MNRRRQPLVSGVLCALCCLTPPFLPSSRARAAEIAGPQETGAAPPAPAPPAPARPAPAPPAPTRPAPAPPASAPASPGLVSSAQQIPEGAEDRDRSGGGVVRRADVVRVASDYALEAGESVQDLVVVMGNAAVDGHVLGELVVVLGEARLGPAAVVDGELTLVGGTLRVEPGAVIRKDLVVAAGSLEAPPDFSPGGEQVVVGFQGLGDTIRGVVPWFARGLLLGRPIVPDLPWVWGVVGILFAFYLGVLLVFEQPVRHVADALVATPLRALAAGLGTVLVAGPLLLLLAASVVGLLAVPFVACALLVAGLVGKVAANAWLGARLVPERGEKGRLTLARSFVVGCVVLILAYMVPLLGGVLWASAGVLGLGASVLAFVSAYRRENPPMAPVPPVPMPDVQALDAPGPPPLAPPQLPPLSPSSQASMLLAMPHAGFADRLAAFALDAILVALLIALMSGIDGQAFVPLLLAFRFAFWVWKGATLGGIVCQLRVIRLDGNLVGPGEAMVRSLGSIFSFGLLGIGCLWILRDPDRQAWHDKMAGTFVVKVPRQWPV